MKFSHLLGSFVLGSVLVLGGCSKPRAFQAADEWHALADTGKEDICKSMKENSAAMMGALDAWMKDASPKIEAKSKDLAAAIAELKEKKDFEKLQKKIEEFNPEDEPCDKMKAKFTPDELSKYSAINSQIDTLIAPARQAYETKAKELNITVDPKKFRP